MSIYHINKKVRNILLIIGFSIIAFTVMGYHPGYEDDGVYLADIKFNLNPALYSHDAKFFHEQLQATVFVRMITAFIRLTHLPLSITLIFFQFAAITLILLSCFNIAQKLFPNEANTAWGGVALVASMFTLPVSGTALFLVDQHLHPRNIATAIILFAILQILTRKVFLPIILLLLAFFIHPLMALMGISFCFFLLLFVRLDSCKTLASTTKFQNMLIPSWFFEPPSSLWQEVVKTRSYYYLSNWMWYEWLGIIAPLILFLLLGIFSCKNKNILLSKFAFAVLVYGLFQFIISIIVLNSSMFTRLIPLQPMRFLHLIYIFMILIFGCYIGKYVLRNSILKWSTFLLIIYVGMFFTQRQLLGNSDHIELPGSMPANSWQQAFKWVQLNTPIDAYFALDPFYLELPGEDYHNFRALAERSQLSDAIKDAAIVTHIPHLARLWKEHIDAQKGWVNFTQNDFEKLKRKYGVDWVIIMSSQSTGLHCYWQNQLISVCKL